MKFLVPCLGISLFLCTFVQAQVAPNTNLILNGSFEESHGLDGITSASRLVPSVPGWTKGGANDFEIQFKKTGGYYPSQGDVKVVLNNIQNSSIVQTVQVETGKRYLLTFDYSSGTTNIDASSLDVKINGEIISGLSSPNPSWKKQEVQFKAEASSIELSFEATGSGDSTGALVDNIRLYPIVNDFYTDNLVVNGSFEDSHNILNNNFKFFRKSVV